MTVEPNEDELSGRDFFYTGSADLNGTVDNGWDDPEEFNDEWQSTLEELEKRIEQLEEIVCLFKE